jgi:hypothetical protein
MQNPIAPIYREIARIQNTRHNFGARKGGIFHLAGDWASPRKRKSKCTTRKSWELSMDHKNINEEEWAMTGRNGNITEGGKP